MTTTLGALLQEPTAWAEALDATAEVGLQAGTLLLSFTLAIFVLLLFVVRFLLIASHRPVPVDPFDMAKPRDFRALIVAAAALLAPLGARSFLPLEELAEGQYLILSYAFELILAVVLWLLLEAFYGARARRRG